MIDILAEFEHEERETLVGDVAEALGFVLEVAEIQKRKRLERRTQKWGQVFFLQKR